MSITIDELHKLCDNGAIRWTEHIAMRMLKRGITRKQVIAAIKSGVIFEQYPDDYPYPSCLLLGYDSNGQAIHVVCGRGPDAIWMVTAYYPDPNEWDSDLKTRKEALQ